MVVRLGLGLYGKTAPQPKSSQRQKYMDVCVCLCVYMLVHADKPNELYAVGVGGSNSLHQCQLTTCSAV